MGLVVNTNTSASVAAMNINNTNASLTKSLNRLSSGVRITSPADDAGGLAVSMKMQAAIKRTEATDTNIQNSVSFLQTQDGALATVGSILTRVGELVSLYNDPTKNSDDQGNYDKEFTALQNQFTSIAAEKFNGVNLFSGTALSVATTEDGQQSVSLTGIDISNTSEVTDVLTSGSAADLSAISTGDVTTALQSVAGFRADNGAQTSQLQFASSLLQTNKTNLEAANSRIIDTDIASESTAFAKLNILMQSGAAMLAQANSSAQIALRLLG